MGSGKIVAGPDLIKLIVAAEIAEFDPVAEARKFSRIGSDANAIMYRRTLQAFETELTEPEPVMVNFRGGIEQQCWAVTRSDGYYRVVYLPHESCFSLTVESVFGPIDISVHGTAIEVFSSV